MHTSPAPLRVSQSTHTQRHHARGMGCLQAHTRTRRYLRRAAWLVHVCLVLVCGVDRMGSGHQAAQCPPLIHPLTHKQAIHSPGGRVPPSSEHPSSIPIFPTSHRVSDTDDDAQTQAEGGEPGGWEWAPREEQQDGDVGAGWGHGRAAGNSEAPCAAIGVWLCGSANAWHGRPTRPRAKTGGGSLQVADAATKNEVRRSREQLSGRQDVLYWKAAAGGHVCR